jgi:hypothetical protein
MMIDEKSVNSNAGNKLDASASPYLRSASGQPVHWFPWCNEAFDFARREQKAVLLDIGAVWCHWCHVMDHESYEDPNIAAIINADFVAIKVDRDERPDIDARYQQALAALSEQGGWPLTGFLTPSGDMFWGGTYFPPDDYRGRASFRRVLREVARFYRENSEEAESQGSLIRAALQSHGHGTGATHLPRRDDVDRVLEELTQQHDSRNGGFGAAPKFPHPSAIDLALCEYARSGNRSALTIAETTLLAMARGGVFDQLGGGFHRYSVDEKWVLPHFEKMLYDNAALLQNYVYAYALTGDARYRTTAENIIGFCQTVLSDAERGGFFASQDADASLTDDGDYWTWSIEEAKEALNESEFHVAQRVYDIYERGEMHVDPRRNVLFVAEELSAAAHNLDLSPDDAAQLLASARSKLVHARSQRQLPFVDTTMYVNWNAMMVTAFLDAARFLRDHRYRDFALLTLRRVLDEGNHCSGGFSHALGRGSSDSIRTLDDQAQMGCALLAAYEATGDAEFVRRAELLAAVIAGEFEDSDAGGFFDAPHQSRDSADNIQFLAVPMKPLQDAPVASANAIAIRFFARLAAVTGRNTYRDIADRSLAALLPVATSLGFHASAYFASAAMRLSPPITAHLHGGPTASREALGEELLALYDPDLVVVKVEPEPRGVGNTDDAYVVICCEDRCSAPCTSGEGIRDTLRRMGKRIPPN